MTLVQATPGVSVVPCSDMVRPAGGQGSQQSLACFEGHMYMGLSAKVALQKCVRAAEEQCYYHMYKRCTFRGYLVGVYGGVIVICTTALFVTTTS
jgi:hypothetical protein